MSHSALFTPIKVGAADLKHRIVMAPLTRMRAGQPDNIPRELNAEYYAQRATPGGLLIAEASPVVPSGQGYLATPGLYSAAQIEGRSEDRRIGQECGRTCRSRGSQNH